MICVLFVVVLNEFEREEGYRKNDRKHKKVAVSRSIAIPHISPLNLISQREDVGKECSQTVHVGVVP